MRFRGITGGSGQAAAPSCARPQPEWVRDFVADFSELRAAMARHAVGADESPATLPKEPNPTPSCLCSCALAPRSHATLGATSPSSDRLVQVCLGAREVGAWTRGHGPGWAESSEQLVAGPGPDWEPPLVGLVLGLDRVSTSRLLQALVAHLEATRSLNERLAAWTFALCAHGKRSRRWQQHRMA